MTPTAEERYEAVVENLRRELAKLYDVEIGVGVLKGNSDLLKVAMSLALRLAYEDGKRDEREACAVEIEQLAVAQGNAECCGFGVGSPPECCAGPVYMISGSLAASAIRARTQSEPSK